jgi:hypothetical protein
VLSNTEVAPMCAWLRASVGLANKTQMFGSLFLKQANNISFNITTVPFMSL